MNKNSEKSLLKSKSEKQRSESDTSGKGINLDEIIEANVVEENCPLIIIKRKFVWVELAPSPAKTISLSTDVSSTGLSA